MVYNPDKIFTKYLGRFRLKTVTARCVTAVKCFFVFFTISSYSTVFAINAFPIDPIILWVYSGLVFSRLKTLFTIVEAQYKSLLNFDVCFAVLCSDGSINSLEYIGFNYAVTIKLSMTEYQILLNNAFNHPTAFLPEKQTIFYSWYLSWTFQGRGVFLMFEYCISLIKPYRKCELTS